MKKQLSLRTRQLLTRSEINAASLCFVLMFLVLLFRIGSSVLIDLLIFLQRNWESGAPYIEVVIPRFSKNIQWTGEGAQWLWVWLVALGIAEAERNESNLKVDFLLKKIKNHLQIPVKIALDLLYLNTILFLFILSFEELERSRNSWPTTLLLPNMFLYLSLTIGFLFLGVRLFLRIKRNIDILYRSKKEIC